MVLVQSAAGDGIRSKHNPRLRVSGEIVCTIYFCNMQWDSPVVHVLYKNINTFVAYCVSQTSRLPFNTSEVASTRCLRVSSDDGLL